jgi:putative transposase
MTPPATPERYKHHRFPAEIISHGVWLYYRFCLSYRDVEELLFARGIIVTYEAIRKWCRRFGQAYANHLRRRRPRPGDKWHLDEVFLTINGARHYLWRAVDQDGHVLDILVQSRRNKKAAKKFFRKLLKGLTYVPRVIITDKLQSYGAAKREILPSVEHRQHRYLIAISMIAPRIHISRPASGSGACRGSSRRVMRSGSSLRMAPSPNTSDRDATGSPPPSIAEKWRNDSRSGRT